jgi:hypothetical protein
MNQEGRVTTERQGHILLIGLDRVARRNAFDRAMLNALGLAYAELEHEAIFYDERTSSAWLMSSSRSCTSSHPALRRMNPSGIASSFQRARRSAVV